MDSLTFFIKVIILTVIAVSALQLRLDGTSLEKHTMNFLRSSALVQPLDETAQGAVVFVRNMWSKITRSVNTNFSNALRTENQPGFRGEKISFKRSEEYVREKAAVAREAARDAADTVQEKANQTSDEVEKRRNVTAGIVKRFKKFIDETEVPGQGEDSSLAKTVEDEGVDEDAQ